MLQRHVGTNRSLLQGEEAEKEEDEDEEEREKGKRKPDY